MDQQTIEKLWQMRLEGMVTAFKEQTEQSNMGSLSFEERFAMIVEREWTSRENRRLALRLKNARFNQQATVEDIDYRHHRGLDKSVVRTLAACQWVKKTQNIIICGPTGIGKSYIAEALAQKACREGSTAYRTKVSRLFRELEIARGDGSYLKLLSRYARIDVLVIDDWGMSQLNDMERKDFLEIMEDRYNTKSTIITSQYPVAKWHDLIGEPTVADAILDRIVHNAHKIILKGDSMRKNRSNLTHGDQGK